MPRTATAADAPGPAELDKVTVRPCTGQAREHFPAPDRPGVRCARAARQRSASAWLLTRPTAPAPQRLRAQDLWGVQGEEKLTVLIGVFYQYPQLLNAKLQRGR